MESTKVAIESTVREANVRAPALDSDVENCSLASRDVPRGTEADRSHSTSYTIRQRGPARKSETESQRIFSRATDDENISAESCYDDWIRKSEVLPPYINLLQAASTYSR